MVDLPILWIISREWTPEEQKERSKDADQNEHMRRLVCAFVAHMKQN